MRFETSGIVKVIQLTANEADRISQAYGASSAHTCEVSGEIFNDESNNPKQISVGKQVELLAPGMTIYAVSGIEEAVRDLVALEADPYEFHPTRILFHRYLQVKQDLDPVALDFTDAFPFSTYTLSAVGGEATAFMITKNSTSIPGLGSTEDGTGTWFMPTEGILAEDRMVFTAFDGEGLRRIKHVRSAEDLWGDYTLDLTAIQPFSGVSMEGNPITYKGLQYQPGEGSPSLSGFDISQADPSVMTTWDIFLSKGWLEESATSSYTIPDFNGVEGWNSDWDLSAEDGNIPCAEVTAVMSNRDLNEIMGGEPYPSGLNLATVKTRVCQTSQDRSWTISEELKAALSFTVPQILRDDLITDQPMIYVFSTYELLPEGTVIGSFERFLVGNTYCQFHSMFALGYFLASACGK
jgi:hypothetical protein